jgi:hypothetical protein
MYVPNKKSARWYAVRHQDMYTDLGFDYRGKIFKKTVSPVILQNKVNKAILSHIEPIVEYLINCVKQVRLQYMFSLDKNDTRVN